MLAVFLGVTLLSSTIVANSPAGYGGEPLTIVNGYAFVNVSIGGKGPFRMMIDTGASSCSLTAEAARAARLEIDHRVVLETMAHKHTVPASSNARLRVGPVEAAAVEVLVIDPGGIRLAAEDADGVLGQSFLERFPYLIDYRRQRLWLGNQAVLQSSGLSTEVAAERVEGTIVIPVWIGAGKRLWRLTLDSGANALVMRCAGHCPSLDDARSGGRIVTNNGTCTVRRGVVQQVTVGDIVIPKAVTALMDGAVSSFDDGLLPASWFSAVYVDSARNVVRLKL